jgi:SHS2 domain-containing protein
LLQTILKLEQISMQRQMKWENWPVLALGIGLVVLLVFIAHLFKADKVFSNYFADLAGAISAVIISIATYDEWERRQERKRYYPPEKMGVKRLKDEVFQLMYQYAFVLNLRWNAQSQAMKKIKATVAGSEFTKTKTDVQAKAAKHISQEDEKLKSNLFKLSKEVLKKPQINKQAYEDIYQLILQTERSIGQIDLALSTYGYSFTPEVHKWALDVREALSQTITGEIPILSIRLAATSKKSGNKLSHSDIIGVKEMLDKLVEVGKLAEKMKSLE